MQLHISVLQILVLILFDCSRMKFEAIIANVCVFCALFLLGPVAILRRFCEIILYGFSLMITDIVSSDGT